MSSAILFLALGLNEELLYRGVIQHATNTLGAVPSVVWVAVLFGVQHVGTGIFLGHSLYDTGAMIISATAFGAAYAAVRLRIGTIWPLAFLRGLENFCNTRSPGEAPWWWYLAVAIFYVLYAVWLLRQFNPNEVGLPADLPVRVAPGPTAGLGLGRDRPAAALEEPRLRAEGVGADLRRRQRPRGVHGKLTAEPRRAPLPASASGFREPTRTASGVRVCSRLDLQRVGRLR
jgi:hypothetical protein